MSIYNSLIEKLLIVSYEFFEPPHGESGDSHVTPQMGFYLNSSPLVTISEEGQMTFIDGCQSLVISPLHKVT